MSNKEILLLLGGFVLFMYWKKNQTQVNSAANSIVSTAKNSLNLDLAPANLNYSLSSYSGTGLHL